MKRSKVKDLKTKTTLVPKLRFPEFCSAPGWKTRLGNEQFIQTSNRQAAPGLPILAITQEHGAIPRTVIDYHVSVTDKSIEAYKEVCPGDFIISLRSFQGGIEYSEYHGICSPAYIILRKKTELSEYFYKHLFKSHNFIRQLTKNLEGLRDGKMISYDQFSELYLPAPILAEQNKIAECLETLDELIEAESQKLNAFKAHKKGLLQFLLPRKGETVPRLRFPDFQESGEWEKSTVEDLVKAKWLHPPRDGNHGSIHPKASDYVTTGIPFVMASDLVDGRINTESCHYISKELADTLQKGFAKEGDVLLSHKGTVGEVAVVRKISAPYLMLTPQVTYYRVNKNEKISNEYLSHLFSSSAFQSELQKMSGGGTRAYIGITEQGKLSVLLPPRVAEQRHIADCLSSLDDLITAQSKKVSSLKTHKQGLMQQLFPSPASTEA